MALPNTTEQRNSPYLYTGITVALGLLCFAVALYCLQFPGTFDIKIWQSRALDGLHAGIIDGFARNQADYPPLHITLLTLSTHIGQSFGEGLFTSIKISLLVFLLGSSALLGCWTRKPLLPLLFFVAMLLDSVCLGYVDIYVAPCFLLAFWFLQRNKLTGFAIAFLLSTLTKWQPLILTPLLLFYVLRDAQGHYQFTPALMRAIIASSVILAGFIWLFDFQAFTASLLMALDNEYLSGNALNFNWLIGYLLNSHYPIIFGGLVNGENAAIAVVDTGLFLPSKILFLVFYSYVLFCFSRADNALYTLVRYCLLTYLVYYTFAIGAHENHLFIGVFLAIILLALDSKTIALPMYVLLSHNINLLVFYGFAGMPLLTSRIVAGVDTSLLLAGINVIACLLFISQCGRDIADREKYCA